MKILVHSRKTMPTRLPILGTAVLAIIIKRFDISEFWTIALWVCCVLWWIHCLIQRFYVEQQVDVLNPEDDGSGVTASRVYGPDRL